jgi:hypothetical protein
MEINPSKMMTVSYTMEEIQYFMSKVDDFYRDEYPHMSVPKEIRTGAYFLFNMLLYNSIFPGGVEDKIKNNNERLETLKRKYNSVGYHPKSKKPCPKCHGEGFIKTTRPKPGE